MTIDIVSSRQGGTNRHARPLTLLIERVHKPLSLRISQCRFRAVYQRQKHHRRFNGIAATGERGTAPMAGVVKDVTLMCVDLAVRIVGKCLHTVTLWAERA